MWEILIWIVIGMTSAVLSIVWAYMMVRMASYGWKRGLFRAEQDNRRDEQESLDENNQHKE